MTREHWLCSLVLAATINIAVQYRRALFQHVGTQQQTAAVVAMWLN